MRILLLALLCVLFYSLSIGQVGFYDGTAEVLGEERLRSTICIGFNDLDGDLTDDLILLDEGKRLKTFTQTAPGQIFDYKNHLAVSATGDWAMVSGDLENDGIPEIIVSSNNSGSQFLKRIGDTYVKQFSTDPVYSQNSNLVDLNNDGYLDFFVCNDDGESLFYINNGSGGMTKTKLIDFKTTPEDDMAGNYSSIFTDIDGDDDLDLYIGKCKAGQTDPTHPNRINTLYINNGDGSYTERGEEFGLAIGAQSWSVDSGDVDNDGDNDILIANHDGPHDLMINDGNGHFDRKTLIPGGYSSFAFQSFFCDFDNNGWLDIIFTEPSETYILFNEGMSFTRRDFFPGMQKAFSVATGDLNSDGFQDLYFGFANSFQEPSSIDDIVLINETNDNNFVQFKLTGTLSNRDAVGAKVTLHQKDKIQTREVVVGKSYGIMNSTVVHFGLGTTTEVDSVTVQWPSGIHSVYTDMEHLNKLYHLVEDECFAPNYTIPQQQLCQGESIEVTLPEGFDSYLWSNGSTDRIISIDKVGWYRAIMEIDGCTIRTPYFQVVEEMDIESDAIISVENLILCGGNVAKLNAFPGSNYQWSTGETTDAIQVEESGNYSVTVTTNCGALLSGDVEIEVVDTEYPTVENDTVMIGEKAVFVGESETLRWYQNKNDIQALAVGSIFETESIFEDLTFYVGNPDTGYSYSTSLMTVVPLNSVGDSIYSENEFVNFVVKRALKINSLKVRTQREGMRRIVINEGGTNVAAFDVNLDVGVSTIEINLALDPGEYSIGTDENINSENLGSVHPYFSYSNIYIANDKVVSGYLQIMDSELNPGVSPYFFDWDIEYGYFDCEPRIPVQAVIKDDVSTKDVESDFLIYPNPTSGRLYIDSDLENDYRIQLFNSAGQLISRSMNLVRGVQEIRMPNEPGLYFLQLTNKQRTYSHKVYVVR